MKEEVNEKELMQTEEVTETAVATIEGLGAIGHRTNTKSNIYTNIKDPKKIFNLDNHVDNLLNDCEGEIIRVKEVLIKRFEKPMKTPEINEETGEIIKDKEVTMSCILIDDNNKSYATGSKIFTIQMMRYISMFGITEEGFAIKITKNKMNEGKSLGFEIV